MPLYHLLLLRNGNVGLVKSRRIRMVKHNQRKLNKLTGAILLASGLAIVGCSSDDTESIKETVSTSGSVTTSGTFASINNPAGSISGLVQDTNGNPISDATVYIGDQTATTNAGGLYYFDEVKITQTVPREDGTYAQALTVSIVPPAGYLGATVTVQPQAQVFEVSTGGGADAEEASATNTVFIDGFIAEAGVAVLPALTASVSGVLRNQATEEAIASAVLSLDVVSVNGNDQEQDIDGVDFSYATANFTATTNASGGFSFSGLPADTLLNITATNLEIIGGATTVDTSNENGMNGLAVTAVPFESVDAVSPYTISVAQVGSQLAARGLLDDDFGTVITVKFSETLDASLVDNVNSVVVRDVTDAAYVSHSNPSVSGNTLTITLDSAVPAGNDIDVWLLKDDFRDTSGNMISILDETAAATTLGFDYDGSTATSSQYVKLQLSVYEEANQNATSPTQSQLATDVTGVDDLEAIQTGTNATNTSYVTFLDVDDDTAGIQQLNSADDDDTSGTPDTDTRLTALLGEIAGNIGALGATTVESDNALISFTSTNASYYYLNVTDEAGNDVVNAISETVKAGATFGADPDVNTRRLDPDADGVTISVLVGDSVAPGYVVTVTPYDDFGYAGTANSITLVDNVAPTTILQTSYGVGNEENGSVTSLQFGDGGEQAGVASVTPGTPFYDLTPRLLGLADGTSDGPNDDTNEVETFEMLFAYNAVNPVASNNTTVAEGDQFIDEATNVYDATAWVDYLAGYDFSRTLGVAFSEDVTLTATAPAFTATGAASAPSAFVANNDVVIDDDGTTVNADLVNFDLADVYDFALQENGAVLDFTDAVQDNAGNVAIESGSSPTLTNNAKVIFRDLIPPMIESAVYRGRELVVVFDKAINTTALIDDAIDMTLTDGADVTLDLSDADNWSYDSGTDTLTINLDAFSGNTNLTTNFALGQYNDYTASSLDDNVSGVRYRHGSLDFSDIQNENGVSWSDYNDLGAANEGYWQQPTFAAVNIVRSFNTDVTQPNISGLGTTTLTDVEIAFTHQVDLSGLGVDGDINASDCGLTSAEIDTMITPSVGLTLGVGNSCTATNNDDGSVLLSFDLAFDSAQNSTNTLTFNFGGALSLYDGSVVANPVVTLP
jgi:hypothetical protein